MLELLDRDAVWVVGLVTAGVSVGTIGGNQIVDVLSKRCGKRSTLLLWATVASAGAALVMGITDSFAVAVGGLLIISVGMGVLMPVRQAYLHEVTPSAQRATVVSFDAMIASVGGTAGQVGLGRLADSRGYSPGYVVGGVLTAAALPVLWRLRLLGESADQLDGPPAVEGTCPAGLPRGTQVASHPIPALVGADGD